MLEETKVEAVKAEEREKSVKNPVMHRLRMVMLTMALVAMMAIPSFAEGTTDAASLLTSTGGVVQSGITIVWTIITGNPVLSAIAGMSILALAFRALNKAKHAARF